MTTTSSLLSVNPDRSSSSRRRNKKKKFNPPAADDDNQTSSVQWKSESQQQIYSSKLLQALRQVRQNNNNNNASGSKRVHEAADRVLAATARGRTRWSRAILTNRLKLKFMKNKKNNIVKRQNKVMTVITSGTDRMKKKSKVTISRLRSLSLPAFQRKGRVLGRLVPGCRKESLPVVLEEATDYIAALEMQIRAMSALAQLLSVSGSTSSSSSSASTSLSSAAPDHASNPFDFGSSSSRNPPT